MQVQEQAFSVGLHAKREGWNKPKPPINCKENNYLLTMDAVYLSYPRADNWPNFQKNLSYMNTLYEA